MSQLPGAWGGMKQAPMVCPPGPLTKPQGAAHGAQANVKGHRSAEQALGRPGHHADCTPA